MVGKFEYQQKCDVNVCKQEISLSAYMQSNRVSTNDLIRVAVALDTRKNQHLGVYETKRRQLQRQRHKTVIYLTIRRVARKGYRLRVNRRVMRRSRMGY